MTAAADAHAPASDPPIVDAVARPRFRQVLHTFVSRPVLTTATVGAFVAIYNVAWIAQNRLQGGFDGDETSYLASALRFRRVLSDSGLGGLASAALHNYRNGPLVPLASALVLRSSSPIASAMVVQPVLHVVVAVGAAATARRLRDDRTALVVGLVTLGLPGLLLSARSFQLVMGAAATLTLAVWALVRSERGTRRGFVVLFGVFVGLMVVSRTVTISYLPGLAVAALMVIERTRKGMVALAGAVAAALVVALPWWISEWSNSIYPYLFKYGYGDGAAPLGPSSPPARVLVRLGLVMTDYRLLLVIPAAIVFVTGLAMARRSVAGQGFGVVLDRHRELAALWMVVVLGWLSLLTSSNIGTYFQLPLEVLAVIGLAALPVPQRLRRGVAGWVLVVAALNIVLLSNWTVGSSWSLGGANASIALFGGVEVSQSIDFTNGDPRFSSTASRSERRSAMRDWAAAQNHTAFGIDELTPEGEEVMQTFLGDIRLFQATTLAFAEELTTKGLSPWEAPTATSAIGDGSVDLTPTDPAGRPRILVAVRATTYTDQEGEPADRVLEDAMARGWYIARTVPLPDGGRVELWVHPDNNDFHGLAS